MVSPTPRDYSIGSIARVFCSAIVPNAASYVDVLATDPRLCEQCDEKVVLKSIWPFHHEKQRQSQSTDQIKNPGLSEVDTGNSNARHNLEGEVWHIDLCEIFDSLSQERCQ
jgi:hypothetical protein